MSDTQVNYQANYAVSIIDSVDIREIAGTMAKIGQFQQVVQSQLKQNYDYGVIPGTQKPTLLKPGAEKILMLLGLRSEFEIADSTRDFEAGFFQYQVRAKLYRGEVLITEGLGAANNRERRYQRQDPYTVDNTVLKMAKKRALVDAALLVGSLSDLFTQDLEDMDLEGEKVSTARRYATDQDGTISKAQAKRMFALAKGDGDLVKAVIKEYGYERSEEVHKTKYDEICTQIESLAKDNGDSGKQRKAGNDLERTRKALYSKAKALGYDNEEIKDFMAILFNVDSSTKLTKEQIIELIRYLEENRETEQTEQAYSEEDVPFAQETL